MAQQAAPHIVIDDLSFVLPDGTPVFTGLTAALPMRRIGLVGDNGTGKTTLLRILTGDLSPSGGWVRVLGSLGYLPQVPSQPEGMSLSGGELIRHRLARLFSSEYDFLLLDEPTNNLDAEARADLCGRIERTSRGIIAVSHDRELLRRMDAILELQPTGLRLYGGNWDGYREQRAIHAAALDQRILTRTLELHKAEWIARVMAERHARRAGTGKRAGIKANLPAIVRGAKKRQAEVTAGRSRVVQIGIIDGLIRNIVELRERKNRDNTIRIELPNTRVPNGKVVCEWRDVTFGYRSDRRLLTGFTRVVVGPRRLAIAGPNGSGKTTLLRAAEVMSAQSFPNHCIVNDLREGDGTLLMSRSVVRLLRGEMRPDAGSASIRVPSVGYLDQRTAGLRDDHTLLAALRAVNPELPESEVRTFLGRLKFRREDVFKRIGVLSGGERMRAALAVEFLKPVPPQLLILDEPTNNLERLESALACYEGALLVISHDETFLKSVRIEETIRLQV